MGQTQNFVRVQSFADHAGLGPSSAGWTVTLKYHNGERHVKEFVHSFQYTDDTFTLERLIRCGFWNLDIFTLYQQSVTTSISITGNNNL